MSSPGLPRTEPWFGPPASGRAGNNIGCASSTMIREELATFWIPHDTRQGALQRPRGRLTLGLPLRTHKASALNHVDRLLWASPCGSGIVPLYMDAFRRTGRCQCSVLFCCLCIASPSESGRARRNWSSVAAGMQRCGGAHLLSR